MKFNIGDRVRIKSEEYLRNHKVIDKCRCVSKMYQYANLECVVVAIYKDSDRGAPRCTLSNIEYPDINIWSWVPQWLEPIKTVDIQADALQDLLQM